MRFLPQLSGGDLNIRSHVEGSRRARHPGCGRIARLPTYDRWGGVLGCEEGSENHEHHNSLANFFSDLRSGVFGDALERQQTLKPWSRCHAESAWHFAEVGRASPRDFAARPATHVPFSFALGGSRSGCLVSKGMPKSSRVARRGGGRANSLSPRLPLSRRPNSGLINE